MESITYCPWAAFYPASVEFCERRLCSWVVEPANTWSNIGFFVVGAIILFLTRKEGRSQVLGALGIIALAVGVGSTFFHTSGTFVGEMVDLGAMFLFAGYLLYFNLWRLKALSARTLVLYYFFTCSFALLVLWFVKPAGIAIFTILITISFALELQLFKKNRKNIEYRFLIYLISLFSLSLTIWRLDFKRRLCLPDNHVLSGHAIWHLLNAWCFYFAYRFYQQFLTKRPSF